MWLCRAVLVPNQLWYSFSMISCCLITYTLPSNSLGPFPTALSISRGKLSADIYCKPIDSNNYLHSTPSLVKTLSYSLIFSIYDMLVLEMRSYIHGLFSWVRETLPPSLLSALLLSPQQKLFSWSLPFTHLPQHHSSIFLLTITEHTTNDIIPILVLSAGTTLSTIPGFVHPSAAIPPFP